MEGQKEGREVVMDGKREEKKVVMEGKKVVMEGWKESGGMNEERKGVEGRKEAYHHDPVTDTVTAA